MSDIEYLDEWPPPESTQTAEQNKKSGENQQKDLESTNSIKSAEDGSDVKRLKLHASHYDTKSLHKLCDNTTSSVDDFLRTENVQLVNVNLARWWRKQGKHCLDDCQYLAEHTHNPNTLLGILARSKEGLAFLHSEISRLKDLLQRRPECAQIHAALGTHYEKIRDWENAEHHLKRTVQLDNDAEYAWHLNRVQRQKQIKAKQVISAERLDSCSWLPEDRTLTFPKSRQVERREADGLSFREFFSTYSQRKIPVIITGLSDILTTTPWNMEHIRQEAGACGVTVKHLVPGSVEWAQLEDSERITVRQYIDSLPQQESLPLQSKTYLFDWSLPLYCPKLAKELTIPKYFAGDFLQRTSPSSLYHDSWPSLFIAPSGLRSELHVDAFGSNFWMALFEGQKHWMFFPKDDVPLLYPSYDNSMDPTFDVDLDSPDLDKFPLMSLTKPMECVLQPGEVLFVPAGCPHRVHNLQKSLAISGNFVDLSNIREVKQELEVNSLQDERSADLLRQLSNKDLCLNMNSEVQHMPWTKYKHWPKDYSQHDLSICDGGQF